MQESKFVFSFYGSSFWIIVEISLLREQIWTLLGNFSSTAFCSTEKLVFLSEYDGILP